MSLLTKCYGNATGPLGFPMRDQVARELETALKEQPEEVKSQFSCEIDGKAVPGYVRACKAPAKADVQEGERTDISLISTETFDRDGEVVLAAGLSFKGYLKNPIVPFNHDYHVLPVGRSLWVKRSKNADPKLNGFLAKTKYLSKPAGWTGDWLPDAVFSVIQQGVMQGKSIGFVPIEVRRPSDRELKARPELEEAGARIIAKAAVFEYSVASIAANPDALATAVAKSQSQGYTLPDSILSMLGLYLPDNRGLEELLADATEPDNGLSLPSLKGMRTPADVEQDARKVAGLS